MNTTKSIKSLIRERYSCRTYANQPLEVNVLNSLINITKSSDEGPFGTQPRFEIIAALNGDEESLKDVGTYGFISNAPAYIIGTIKNSDKNLEDLGYCMEKIILGATNLGLGTCWLGGTFTRSRFAKRISLNEEETIPAVTAVGYISSKPRELDIRIRKAANSDQRLPWEELFFNPLEAKPLSIEDAGVFRESLEMVRLGPSASNKQPWRVVKDRDFWHFYLSRTPGYRDNPYIGKLQIADLQRIDMGIAMCHFELTTKEMGLEGCWEINEPDIDLPEKSLEYLVSWVI